MSLKESIIRRILRETINDKGLGMGDLLKRIYKPL